MNETEIITNLLKVKNAVEELELISYIDNAVQYISSRVLEDEIFTQEYNQRMKRVDAFTKYLTQDIDKPVQRGRPPKMN